MTRDPEIRPLLEEFPSWLESMWEGDLRELRRGRYLHHQSDLLNAFDRSPFWKRTVESLPDCAREYERQHGFILFKDQRVVPPLFDKPWESFLSRCWRTNVRNNENWPDPPEGGWLLPDNWFERSQDIVRTRLVVRYLDGVEWLDSWLRDVADKTGAVIRGPRVAHAGEWGYYAMHVVVTQPFEAETIDYEDLETRSSGIEIQLTTELQDVISQLTHPYFEHRREAPPPEKKWQWDYISEEFTANYLGHMCHFIEGMIMQVRHHINHPVEPSLRTDEPESLP